MVAVKGRFCFTLHFRRQSYFWSFKMLRQATLSSGPLRPDSVLAYLSNFAMSNPTAFGGFLSVFFLGIFSFLLLFHY